MTIYRPLVPQFFADDVREDWQEFAMLRGSAALAGIGDAEGADDLFFVLYFGA